MAKKDLSKIPATVTLKNNGTEDVGFRYFRVNFTEVLAAGDEVVLTAASSEEVAYYMAQANAEIGLKVTVA